MSLSAPVLPRPTRHTPAAVAGFVVTLGGFLLLAAAVASGAPEGIWSSALIVGAGAPLRHSLEPARKDVRAVRADRPAPLAQAASPDDATEAARPAGVRAHPLLLALALAMTTAGALLGILLSH